MERGGEGNRSLRLLRREGGREGVPESEGRHLVDAQGAAGLLLCLRHPLPHKGDGANDKGRVAADAAVVDLRGGLRKGPGLGGGGARRCLRLLTVISGPNRASGSTKSQ